MEEPTLLDKHVPLKAVEHEIREREDGSYFWRVRAGRHIASGIEYNLEDATTAHEKALGWARQARLTEILRTQL